jgi:hypothetical protein
MNWLDRLLVLLGVACMVTTGGWATDAAAGAADDPYLIQIQGTVLIDGSPATAPKRLVAESRLELRSNASVIAITPQKKMQIDGPNFGRVDELLSQIDATVPPSSAGALGAVYGLFANGFAFVALRGADHRLTDAWSLRLDTPGAKCVRPKTRPVLVSQRGQQDSDISLRNIDLNQSAYGRIGHDGRFIWPSELPIGNGARYEIRIDGVASALFWNFKVASSDLDNPGEAAKWLIDNECFDQAITLVLQIPNSQTVRGQSK